MGEQENPISQNRYTYVWNSPNKYVDKSGQAPARRGNNPVKDRLPSKPTPPAPNPIGAGQNILDGDDDQSYHINEINKIAMLRGISYSDAEKIYWRGKSGDSQSEYERENEAQRQRAAAAEAARIAKLQEEWAEAQRIADEMGLNIDVNMDGWTLEQKIAYLREVIRICDELASGNIDVGKAQEEVNRLIPDNNWDKVALTIDMIFFSIDGVYFGIQGEVIRTLAEKGMITELPKWLGPIKNTLLAFGIGLLFVNAIHYWYVTRDLAGAIGMLLTDSIGMATGMAIVDLLVVIGTMIAPGVGTLIGAIIGTIGALVFSLWWNNGGKNVIQQKLTEFIRSM